MSAYPKSSMLMTMKFGGVAALELMRADRRSARKASRCMTPKRGCCGALALKFLAGDGLQDGLQDYSCNQTRAPLSKRRCKGKNGKMPMAQPNTAIQQRRFGATLRRDTWWAQPLIVLLTLSSFIVYSTWAAFQGKHYYYGPYLSPFYSPEIFGESPHAWWVRSPAGGPAGCRSRRRC